MASIDKPTRYIVEYDDQDLWVRELERCQGHEEWTDPALYRATRDAETMKQAKLLAKRLTGVIYERTNIHMEPDQEIGYFWDYDNIELVDDSAIWAGS